MPDEAKNTSASGTLVTWSEGIGNDRKYHLAHVSPAGITLVLKLKDPAQQQMLAAAAGGAPDPGALLRSSGNAVHFPPDDLARVTYAQQLNQLTLFDRDGKKTKVPEGKEQAEVFEAIRQHLGGTATEEEADAWSVMKAPLFTFAVIAVIGGFFIWFTSICEPEIEATGRRQGMKILLNKIGYAIGPVWMSVVVGTLAALVIGAMIVQLIKRPIRNVLTYG